MNFSMYSCSHFSDFLSDDQVRKQSAKSKSGQKTTSNEGSPTAKAKPCLVLREQRSEEISSRSLGSLVNPENADERNEVVQASRQLVQSDKKMFRKHPGNWRRRIKTKQKVMRGNIPTPQAQGNLVRHHQN